jgi:hypothetical protein
MTRQNASIEKCLLLSVHSKKHKMRSFVIVLVSVISVAAIILKSHNFQLVHVVHQCLKPLPFQSLQNEVHGKQSACVSFLSPQRYKKRPMPNEY